jgi:predicted transcriptional regulator
MSGEQAERTETPLISLTAEIVAGFLKHNHVALSDLPGVIQSVHRALESARKSSAPVAAPQVPAVPIKKSVRPDSIACLECGAEFKAVRRHLRTAHDLTRQAYREKWKLPADYPLVAPGYAELRSRMAKKVGLGKRPEPASSSPPATTSRKRAGQKRKSKQAA